MTDTKTLDLEPIRDRADDATNGPWTVGDLKELDGKVDVYELAIQSPSTNEDHPDVPDEVAVVRYNAGGFQFPHADARADAEFIARARTDVPALLSEVERLRSVETAVLHMLALAPDEYRQCIVAARASVEADEYAKNNGRAEMIRVFATGLAERAGLPVTDWEQIKQGVPSDGVYRQSAGAA